MATTPISLGDIGSRVEDLETTVGAFGQRVVAVSVPLNSTSNFNTWEHTFTLPTGVDYDGTWRVHAYAAYGDADYLVYATATLEADWPINASQSTTRACIYGGSTHGSSAFFVRTNTREMRVDYTHTSFDYLRVFFTKV